MRNAAASFCACCVANVVQLVKKPCGMALAEVLLGVGQEASVVAFGVPVKKSWNVPGAPKFGAPSNGPVPAVESRMKFHGFGTVWSQNAACVSTAFADCATLPLGFASRFGSVFACRWPAKFTGSAGSRMVFATTRNWRYAEFAPGWIPSPASSALVVETNAGEVVKTST